MTVPQHFEIEHAGESSGICDCCGHTSHCVWGFVHEVEGPTLAAYFVRWTDGHLEDVGADLDLIIGEWGDGTTADDRSKVSMVHREMSSGAEVMVVDAGPEPGIAASALKRDEVIGTPLAPYIFRLTDAVYLQDGRFF